MKTFEIKYHYGTYSGMETVQAEDGEQAIAIMWRRLRKYMTLPMAYRSAKIVNEY
jgi:hypothetical protein